MNKVAYIMKPISFTSDYEELKGKLFLPDTPVDNNPAVLIIHGWKSRQRGGEYLAQALSEKGYIVMTFDLRGHGESAGNLEVLSRTHFLADAEAAYDVLAGTPGVDNERITVIGSSFGGYLAALLSSKRKVHALVLRVPANYFDRGFDDPQERSGDDPEREIWRGEVHPYVETASLRAVHDFTGRVLVVESERDEQIPSEVIRSYCNAVTDPARITHVVMKDAPHSISRDEGFREEYRKIVLEWIG
jgi:esterase/lipase